MGWLHELLSEYAVEPPAPDTLRVVSPDHDWNAPDRVTKLEQDLARANLLLQALTEAALNKGIISRQDIESAAREIDKREREQEEATSIPNVTPEEHLARLGQQET